MPPQPVQPDRAADVSRAHPNAFRPDARLHSPAQYQRVLRASRCLHGATVRLHLHEPNRAGKGPRKARLGITVSKRVSKLAVIRNRFKRITRDSFRRHYPMLPPGDYVIVAKSGKALSEGLAQELALLWQRAISLNPTGDTGTMAGSTTVTPASETSNPVGERRPSSSDH
ncbi:MAG: ribonuclease P protein component [Lysobacterales bacterium CG_4_10_14_3_um_filter_64_11]|nr:MAG: ribonuclease P protein component [Xanthomonadales bacterium CG_4_10_14_3_um_filter_64_11]